MPLTIDPYMYIKTYNYDQTGGYRYRNLDSGWIVVDGQVTKPVPYLWWKPHTATHSDAPNWWEGEGGYGNLLDELEKLDFHRFKEYDSPSFYYLILPEIEGNPFPDLLWSELFQFPYYNPTVDLHDSFGKLLRDGHTINAFNPEGYPEDWHNNDPDDRDLEMLINYMRSDTIDDGDDDDDDNDTNHDGDDDTDNDGDDDTDNDGDDDTDNDGDDDTNHDGDDDTNHDGDDDTNHDGDDDTNHDNSDLGDTTCTTLPSSSESDCLVEAPQSVPEYSSVLTFILLGFVFFAGVFKRKLK